MKIDETPSSQDATTLVAAAPIKNTAAAVQRRRRHTIAMVILGAVILGLIGVGIRSVVVTELQYRRDMGLRPNPAERQEKQAQLLLAQLNSHNASRVDLPTARGVDRDYSRARRNVLAAMPRQGCHYDLDSVQDRGVHDDLQIGDERIRHVYRYDIHVREQCPQSPPVPMTIGVLSTPSTGGHWYPAALTVEQ
ncbi:MULTISPECIES: hypothetical protein [Mycolicibacterium]|uniref:hypothetical protein n=1 Tax=Mycolicibacterium TaxID=1866885 RepID=UPI001CDD8DF4|nr:hypothetical protein [Mycolicibacterium fortuitum]UBV20311.1 hypothetical protein H8Z59_24010 [Mycolicibacterium fortuitum]